MNDSTGSNKHLRSIDLSKSIWSSRTIDQKFVRFQRSLYHCCLRLMPVVFSVFCCLKQGLLYFCWTTKRCFWQIWNWDDDSRQLKSPRQLRRSSEQPRDARRCPGRLETERERVIGRSPIFQPIRWRRPLWSRSASWSWLCQGQWWQEKEQN